MKSMKKLIESLRERVRHLENQVDLYKPVPVLGRKRKPSVDVVQSVKYQRLNDGIRKIAGICSNMECSVSLTGTLSLGEISRPINVQQNQLCIDKAAVAEEIFTIGRITTKHMVSDAPMNFLGKKDNILQINGILLTALRAR